MTSQPGEKKKKQQFVPKPNQKKKVRKAEKSPSPKGNGLTRAEIVARAQQKVHKLETEIGKTQRNLESLRRQLVAALAEAEEARSLPPRSAAGVGTISADQKAQPKIGKRIIISTGPKGAVIEHRVARRRKADGADQV